MKSGYVEMIQESYRKRAAMDKEVLAVGEPVGKSVGKPADAPKGLPDKRPVNSNGDATPDTDEIRQGYAANGSSDPMITGSGEGPEY